jgi:hypothetical protein
MVDELPQQELLVAWGQIEQQAGLFDGFQGAMSPVVGDPEQRPTQRLALGDERSHGGLPFSLSSHYTPSGFPVIAA